MRTAGIVFGALEFWLEATFDASEQIVGKGTISYTYIKITQDLNALVFDGMKATSTDNYAGTIVGAAGTERGEVIGAAREHPVAGSGNQGPTRLPIRGCKRSSAPACAR